MLPVTLAQGVQHVERDGAHLAFDFESATSQPTQLLLLVNGFQRPRGDFRAFRKRLGAMAPHIATVALDNRGTGESALVSDAAVSVEQMALDASMLAEAFASKLALSHFDVLGISMGGLISLALSRSNPKVSHLVLVSTTAGGRRDGVPSWLADEKKKEFRPWPQDEEGMRARMRPYFGRAFLERSPLLFDMMIKNMLKKAGDAQAQTGSKLQYTASRSFDASPFLGEIKAKTLIVTGEEDEVMPPANSRYLNENLPGSRLVQYPSVGHLILIEEPEKFVADVANFLQS